VLVIWAKDIN